MLSFPRLSFALRPGVKWAPAAATLPPGEVPGDLPPAASHLAEQQRRLEAQQAQLGRLAHQANHAVEGERKRIARLVHDDLQQLIVAAVMRLELASQRSPDGGVDAESVAAALRTLRQAQDAARTLAIDLRPPVLEVAGLAGGLEWLVSWMSQQHDFAVRLSAAPDAEPAGEEARYLLFECARELLFNAVKHAGVGEATVRLRRHEPGTIELLVTDRGAGFDPGVLDHPRADQISFGLFSLRKRLFHCGGDMEVESVAGEGTSVRVHLPVGTPADGREGAKPAQAADD